MNKYEGFMSHLRFLPDGNENIHVNIKEFYFM